MSSAAADHTNSPLPQLAPVSTFWCHLCDVSVTLLRSSSPLVCPHCRGNFLDEMDGPFPRHFDDDDLFDDFPSSDEIIVAAPAGRSYPAPKSSIDAIPDFDITAAFLADQASLICAICKDEFPLGSGAKWLPCTHIFHGDCIIPWLSQRNSCPVCRIPLPGDGGGKVGGGGQTARIVRFRRLLNDGVLDSTNELEHADEIWLIEDTGVATPTQVSEAEAEAEAGSMGPANSGESVSSRWTADGGASSVGGGERVGVDDEVAIPVVRGGFPSK